MKKHRLLAAMLALMFILAGCNSNKTGSSTGEIPETTVEETSADTGITERDEKTVTTAALPSGNLTSDGEYMASIVTDSGHTWSDFFIFAASGTKDFAYSSFKYQIEAMTGVSDGTFRYADNERDGNLYFLEQEGGIHSGEYAMEYFYNGLRWIWQS